MVCLGGVLQIGFSDRDYSFNQPSLLNILGELIIIGEGKHLFSVGTSIYIAKNAQLSIDEGFTASHNLKIFCRDKIFIGKNNMWSYYVILMDNDGHIMMNAENEIINKNEPVFIDDNCWIGCRCTILKGSIIPNGTIVGANSIVCKSLEYKNSIYCGQGPSLIRKECYWRR